MDGMVAPENLRMALVHHVDCLGFASMNKHNEDKPHMQQGKELDLTGRTNFTVPSYCPEVMFPTSGSDCFAEDGSWCTWPSFRITAHGNWMCANCASCIPRGGTPGSPPSTPCPSRWLNDNECDDGGPGSQYDVCKDSIGGDEPDCGRGCKALAQTCTLGSGARIDSDCQCAGNDIPSHAGNFECLNEYEMGSVRECEPGGTRAQRAMGNNIAIEICVGNGKQHCYRNSDCCGALECTEHSMCCSAGSSQWDEVDGYNTECN